MFLVIVITDQNTDLLVIQRLCFYLKTLTLKLKKLNFVWSKIILFTTFVRTHTLNISQSHTSNENKFVWKQKIIEPRCLPVKVSSFVLIRNSKTFGGPSSPSQILFKGCLSVVVHLWTPYRCLILFFLDKRDSFPPLTISPFSFFLSFLLPPHVSECLC